MTYDPSPIDTSGIELDEGLRELVERLAAHNHDHWALGRLSQGWKAGARRDDAAKTHPGLVQYQELPEAEKDFDRRSVVETVKAILALGYVIERRQ